MTARIDINDELDRAAYYRKKSVRETLAAQKARAFDDMTAARQHAENAASYERQAEAIERTNSSAKVS